MEAEYACLSEVLPWILGRVSCQQWQQTGWAQAPRWWYDPVVYMGTSRVEVRWWSSCMDTLMIAGESAIMNR